MPAPFRFQTLLDYRQRAVEDRQIELAAMQRHLAEVQARLDRLLADQTRFAAQLQHMVQGILRVDAIEHQYRHLAALAGQVAEQRVLVDAVAAEVEASRARLEAALKARKTLEKLREQDAHHFQEALRQREAKTLDDLNITRYSRAGG